MESFISNQQADPCYICFSPCITFAEFTRRAKSSQKALFKVYKVSPNKQQAKLGDFIRESGELLSLFISLLLSVSAGVAALTCSVLIFTYAVFCLQIVTHVYLLITIRYKLSFPFKIIETHERHTWLNNEIPVTHDVTRNVFSDSDVS